MGKCTSLIRNFRHDQDKALVDNKQGTSDDSRSKNQLMMRKIELINNWQSYELETVIQKIMTMCEYEKKNHMNFTLFLQFFPALKPMSMKTQLRYFDLFDFTKSSYINIREIIFGITQIYFTPRSQYSEILKDIYKRGKGDHLTSSELKLFLNENKALIDPSLKTDKNYEKNLSGKEPIQESNFDLMIAKYFDIRQYQRIFDFYDTELEISILEELKTYKHDDNISISKRSIKIKSLKQEKTDEKKEEMKEEKKAENYEIRINRGDKVFLIDKNWFEAWVKYMAIHGCYEIIYEIENAKETFFERKSFSFDEVFMENAKLTRPPKIYNYDLLSEYETDLKPSLSIFEDFIPLPEKMWKKLVSIYKGGPEIERVYPHLFDTIVINKVSIDSKAKFIEGKVVRCILQPHQTVAEIYKTENKAGCLFFKRVPTFSNRQNLSIQDMQGLSKWQELDRSTEVDESLHQGFICIVPEGLKPLFQSNYRSFGPNPNLDGSPRMSLTQKSIRLSYGQIINLKTFTYYDSENSNKNQHLLVSAYVTDIRKNDARLHFVGTSDTCDDYYNMDELAEGITNNKIIVTNKNIVTTFQGLENCSYINAVLQVLIASPFFSDYFLKQKHIRSLSHDTNLQSCLSSYFSKVIYDVKKHQKQTVKPDDLYKKISSKVEEVNLESPTKQYAEKFISKFLETLSSQLGNPEKLFDKYSLVTNMQENKDEKFKGSIIEAFFKLSQSTKSICSACKSESITTDESYTLKVPLPEDQEVCYSVIYCPISCKNFIKYAITIRKSEKFIKYVHKFADQIKIDHSRICFAEVKNNEFRKHYTQYDYESSLFNLDLNPTDSIYVFELRNHRFNKQIEYTEVFHDKFLQLKIGDIVDFNMYTEWHVGKIVNINSKDKIVIENFEGQSEVEKKKIDAFKEKTEEKGWYQIDLLHRRINMEKQERIEYFLTPSILTIAEWMSWGSMFSIVKNYVRNYFDLQENKVFDDKMIASDLFMRIFQFLGTAPEQESNRSPHPQKQEQKQEQSQSCVFSQEDIVERRSDRSMQTRADSPSFAIKIFLKNSGEICAICQKKSLFQKESSHPDSKYCYGCTAYVDDNEPIAIKVNPAKISIVLDWIPLEVNPLIIKVLDKTEEHPTYRSVTTKIKNQINTIDDCFQLYIQTNKKVEIDCDKCGRNLGQQTRYLSESPNMLIIHLNRFKTYKNLEYKLNNKIQVKRELTIEKIQMESKKEDIYQLYGIICHRQVNQTVEKWYSCILKSKNIWVKCEDTTATLIDFNKIDKQEIYLLMYRKKNIKCTILSMIF